DAAPQVMRTLDPDMAERLRPEIERRGVALRLDAKVTGFEPGAVLTADGSIPADLVVLGLGVTPHSGLAADAGVRLGVRDAISVDRRQRTSAEGVWAAGDCAESFHRVSERPIHVALGTVANKQGRVAGVNLGG